MPHTWIREIEVQYLKNVLKFGDYRFSVIYRIFRWFGNIASLEKNCWIAE